ncbi:glycoside hydrolase family 88 protein [Blautia schinkii]|nr:glycoside hydrolase family 88 protein [Blautia schinkii]
MLGQEEKKWAEEILARIAVKMDKVAARCGHKIPYIAVDGIYDDRSDDENICWWTNGFWGGIMWQMYQLTGKSEYMEYAVEVERKLDKVLMNAQGLDHDNGFKWLPTSVANYRKTGSIESKNRAMLAANNMAGRFNPAGKFIRAWNDWGDEDHRGWAIIDCMMNLPLLYWAYEETKDPRFCQIATAHADTAMGAFVRGDGSVCHIVEFDPETGERRKSYGGQGYDHGSSWTRGQSWAVYGFVLSFMHTKKQEYLDVAKRIANYFIANLTEDNLVLLDFRQPEECQWEDSIAAAVTACGLIEIAKVSEGRDRGVYLRAAMRILKALAEHRCNWDENVDYFLEKCSVAYHNDDIEVPIVYGDYYFIEALMKLADKELFIW